MSKWKVRYTKIAFAELDAIYHYIAENLKEPEISTKQVRRIMTAISKLDDMPMRNPMYNKEPWKSRGLRKLLIDKYVIFYIIDENIGEVTIMHILYSGRNIDKMLKDEANNNED